MTPKRPKLHHHPTSRHQHHHHHHQQEQEQEQELIPGLPDHISHLILNHLPPSLLFSISTTFRHHITSSFFPPYLSLYTLLSSTTSSNPTIHFSSFDPIHSKWVPLPPPPYPLLAHHPSFISRSLPIHSLSLSNTLLVIVAATSQQLKPALPRPIIFDTRVSSWLFGPHLSSPRRWCASTSLGPTVYVASGVGSHFDTHTARSLVKWDLRRRTDDDDQNNAWAHAEPLKHGRFSREGVTAVGWRGRICVAHVVAREGAVYYPGEDTWRDMSGGMVDGWRGPVAVLDEQELYVVDESKGILRRYAEDEDCWVDVLEDKRLRGAQQMAVGGAKICVVTGGGVILVVDVKSDRSMIRVVEPPVGFKPVSVHVLPRMSRPDYSILLVDS